MVISEYHYLLFNLVNDSQRQQLPDARSVTLNSSEALRNEATMNNIARL